MVPDPCVEFPPLAADRDFSDLTAGLDRVASDLAPAAKQHVRTISDQLDAIARGDFGSVFQDAHDDVTLEIFAPCIIPTFFDIPTVALPWC